MDQPQSTPPKPDQSTGQPTPSPEKRPLPPRPHTPRPPTTGAGQPLREPRFLQRRMPNRGPNRGPGRQMPLQQRAENVIPLRYNQHNKTDEATPAAQPAPQLLSKGGTQGVRIVFLGGLGDVRIGKNMMAIESGNDIIIIDCGIGFPTDEMLGIDLVIPDAKYLEERKQFVRAYFLTHGHEDHVSGLPFIWPKVPAPVYGTKLTLAMAGKKLEEYGLLDRIQMHTIKPGDRIQVGPFNVEPVRVNHAIPDAVGFAIRTPEGMIFNTGDWKIDHTPPFGDPIDLKRISELASEGITMLMSDSTTADVPGYTLSEKTVADRLEALFEKSMGRIIVASFASQINRIQQVFNAAKKFRRKIVVLGRSLERNANISLEHGFIEAPEGLLVDVRDINKLRDEEICILATGSQGEQYAALTRMSSGDHRWVKIKPGDTIILSASIIPGNEAPVSSTINNLYREGAEVFRGKDFDVHVSGHGGQEELKLMMAITKPKFFVPIHGTFGHLVQHARIAQGMGIEPKNIMVAEDGDFIELKNGQAKLIQNKLESTYILVDGSGIGDVGNIVLRDRQAMSKDGIFMVVLTVDHKTGKIVTSPDIISRGFVYMRAAEDLIFKTRQEVKNMFARHNEKYPMAMEQIKRGIREDLTEFLFQKTQRRPMVIPVVIEV